MQATSYAHIVRDDEGILRIDESWYKLRLMIEEYLDGATPEDMIEAHPLLTMAMIHSAIAYYWDHKAEMDAEIEEGRRYVEEFFRTQPEAPVMARLRKLKRERGG